MMSGETQENGDAARDLQQTGRMSKKCEFLRENVITRGNWLGLKEMTYRDPEGQERTWEALERTTRQDGHVDGVVIMAVMRRLLHYDCAIFVRQYRPPVKAYTLEFPAGLLDAGETTEVAALRELKEETGYTATIKHCSPATCLDPGTASCTVTIVTAEIDGDEPVNKDPKPSTEDGEFIEVLHIPTNQLLEKINELSADGVVVDARVYTYAIALTQATKQRQLVPEQK